jgi:hypothetical protein
MRLLKALLAGYLACALLALLLNGFGVHVALLWRIVAGAPLLALFALIVYGVWKEIILGWADHVHSGEYRRLKEERHRRRTSRRFG